ncbi:MAG: DNA-processing protein DprA [Clostridia bacterium]|nr:DNA-processing protein DprA [Clostridia bacterium]
MYNAQHKTNTKYWIWLSRIQKLTTVQKAVLLKKFNTPQAIWELNYNNLIQVPELDEKSVNEILNNEYRENLEKYEEYISKNNIKLITLFDEEYPKSLKNIYDTPIMLFAKGNTKLLENGGIAIVGSRNCTLYGSETAKKLAYNLAKKNIPIISGLARGIDKYSHIGALEAQGDTIAVLGNGLDYIYPYENKNLYERILENNGLIVTEYVIGTQPSKINFPARNRIISGLADGVTVVEAQKRSGALITADFALEQGKEVFAVPGNVNSANSEGTNELIKQGATLVTNYQDIISAMCHT